MTHIELTQHVRKWTNTETIHIMLLLVINLLSWMSMCHKWWQLFLTTWVTQKQSVSLLHTHTLFSITLYRCISLHMKVVPASIIFRPHKEIGWYFCSISPTFGTFYTWPCLCSSLHSFSKMQPDMRLEICWCPQQSSFWHVAVSHLVRSLCVRTLVTHGFRPLCVICIY